MGLPVANAHLVVLRAERRGPLWGQRLNGMKLQAQWKLGIAAWRNTRGSFEWKQWDELVLGVLRLCWEGGCGCVRAPLLARGPPRAHTVLSLGGVRRPASKGQGKARVGWSGQQAELTAESVSLVWGQVLTEHVGFPHNGGQDPAPGLPVGCLGTKWWGRWAGRLALKSSYLTGRKQIRSLGLSFQPGAAPRGGGGPVNSASR